MEDANLPLTQCPSYAVAGGQKWPTATFLHIEDYTTGAVRWSPGMAEAQTNRVREALGHVLGPAALPVALWPAWLAARLYQRAARGGARLQLASQVLAPARVASRLARSKHDAWPSESSPPDR